MSTERETMRLQVVLCFISFGCSLGYSETTSDLKILELEKKLSELEKITMMLAQKLTITDNNLTDMILKLKQSKEENSIIRRINLSIRRELKLLTSTLNVMRDNSSVGPKYISPESSKQQLTNFQKQEKPYTESLQKRLLLMSNEANSSHKPRIGFTALTTGHQTHMGIGQAVQFPKIVTNDGNGFDQNTGIFRAPLSGLYLFSASMLSHAGLELRCALVHNGNAVAYIFAGDGTTHSTGSKSILLNLSPNDEVWVRITHESDNVFGDAWSSFMGVLISS